MTTGTGNLSNTPVTANSLSHYFGYTTNIAIVKLTNGTEQRHRARPVRARRQHGDLDL